MDRIVVFDLSDRGDADRAGARSCSGVWLLFYCGAVVAEDKNLKALFRSVSIRALRRDLQFVGTGDSAGTSNLQVSPLRRQKAPPPVEMTMWRWGRKEPDTLFAAFPIYSI